MSIETDDKQLIKELLLENQRLLQENNDLLQRMRRSALWAFWVRLSISLIFIGAPFVLYYFVIEPYFASLGSSFETFQTGLQEIPGWKQFYDSMSGGGGE